MEGVGVVGERGRLDALVGEAGALQNDLIERPLLVATVRLDGNVAAITRAGQRKLEIGNALVGTRQPQTKGKVESGKWEH